MKNTILHVITSLDVGGAEKKSQLNKKKNTRMIIPLRYFFKR